MEQPNDLLFIHKMVQIHNSILNNKKKNKKKYIQVW